MANIEVGLLETERQISSMIEASGKTVPQPGERANIVDHLDYIIQLLGTMVSAETFEAAKEKMANGYNAINDRIEIVNWLLASGEISGDVDLEPLTITENGEYMPGAGKAYSRVVVETPEDQSAKIISREFTTIDSDTVTKVGSYAFYNCSSLVSISFPVCSYVGDGAFQNCLSLVSISFPVCSYVGDGAFQNCSSLVSISFPVCSYVGSGAFQNCSSLVSVDFPACSYVGSYAFYNCSSLVSISFPVCSYVGSNAFRNCLSLVSVDFPACSYVASYAFYNCSSLVSISFPVCSYVGSSAFQNCLSLVSIYLFGSSICSLNNINAFNSTPIYNYSNIAGRWGSVYVPAPIVDQYKMAKNWSIISSRITAYIEP